jgi:hypothetical protein
MRYPRRPAIGWLVALFAALGALACQSSSGPSPGPESTGPGGEALHPHFSAARALADLKKLDGIGPRETGSRGAARARSLLRSRLEKIGAEVDEYPAQLDRSPSDEDDTLARTLVGVLPGASDDVFLLAAHYDTWREFGDAGAFEDERPPADEASAVALVLELGRALVERPIPYTVWLVFVDGDGHSGSDTAWDLIGDSVHHADYAGSNAFVDALGERDALSRIRVAIYFDRVGAEHLMIARDLRSHRVYREVFWESARDLGGDAVFVMHEHPVSVTAGHEAFLRRGMRRAVALTANEPSLDLSVRAPAPRSCCSAESLQTVGSVSLEALERIADRLDRIDRFSRSPLAPVPGTTEGEPVHDPSVLEENEEPGNAAPPPTPDSAPESTSNAASSL